ncbi:hypothetical protein ABVT39_009475 [Epinephelus coioides]
MARSSLPNTTGDGMYESPKGKKTPKNKISDADKNKVKEHIKSFQTTESHYCHKDSSKAYLEGMLNLRKMYELYTQKCIEWKTTPVKESMYRNIFTSEFNIAFHTPKKDACRQCEAFQNLPQHEKTHQIEEYLAHQSRKEQAREHKNKDKEAAQTTQSLKAITFDLEQVLTSPWCNVSSLYYSGKLSTYNLTLYELDTKDAHCFMWHEGEGGRGSSEISTCVYNYLCSLSPEVNHIIMYSDTCGGQNRNVGFRAMCLRAVQDLPLLIIDHKFLESGHSQKECDSIHAAIETARKSVPVYSPDEYYTLVRAARHKHLYKVHELNHKEFIDFKTVASRKIKNKTKDNEGQQVSWLKMKWMRYMKREKNAILFKYDTDASFRKHVVNKDTRSSTSTLPTRFQSPPGISAVTLCTNGSIPQAYVEFYSSLKVAD